ncbi:MAG TPA: class I SAM-dependent methyltransferase [Longimicrobiales bacterium]|nr:class I SAM-dependent methyltransferase [Longimicrobiales bacterium]
MSNREIIDFREHYATSGEANRLTSGHGLLERIRTQDILARFLPPAPARVLDIGGGPGVYSLWLLERGYQVELLDAVPLHVEQARNAFARAGYIDALATVGDARVLPYGDASAQAVLLLGPLYHLTSRDDRLGALREARRVLQPGGILAAATISRFASLLDGYWRNLVADPDFKAILEQDLRDGQHRNPMNNPDYFTTAYLQQPAEHREEVVSAGFEVTAMIAVEGPFWLLPDFAKHWSDLERRAEVLRHLKMIETEESLLGSSAHLLTIARNHR